MSTKFSGGKIPRKSFWLFRDSLRKAILDNHPFLKFMENNEMLSASDFFNLVEVEHFHHSLQVFPVGKYFYVRFLSEGYFIENNLEDWREKYEIPKEFEQIGIHTGGQSSEEVDELYGKGTLKIIEDIIGPMVIDQCYFIATLIDETTLMSNRWQVSRKKANGNNSENSA
jgi:hypothetical protein